MKNLLNLRTTMVAAALATLSAAALARGFDTAEIDARQHQQAQRIEQGLASGQLNRREAGKLEEQQRRIAKTEARAKADGVVSRTEHRQLVALLDQASRDIDRQKHDAQTAHRR